jgi:hypothetical protein
VKVSTVGSEGHQESRRQHHAGTRQVAEQFGVRMFFEGFSDQFLILDNVFLDFSQEPYQSVPDPVGKHPEPPA